MDAKHNSDEFQVALLIDDIQDAKRLSDSLRKLGIFAHYYQDLDEMWVALNAYTPGFCIIDVKKISSGSLQFRQHPKVRAHKLKLAFFYKDSTKILVSSLKALPHYGLVRNEIDLEAQLGAIFARRKAELQLEDELYTMRERVARLKLRAERLSEQHDAEHAKIEQLENLNELIRQFGRVETQQGFYQRVLHVFSHWGGCLEFGMYYLNSSKQKLVSPKGAGKSYRQLPELWLDKANSDGIESYAQEMAGDVCYEEMEGELVHLRIEGLYNGPDILIWGRFDKKTIHYFQWDLLEEKLNSEYRKVVLRERDGLKLPHSSAIHQLLFELDEIQFHKVESKYRYLFVDFSKLLSMARQRPKLRLNWKQFNADFRSEVHQVLGDIKYKVTAMAPGHYVISLDRHHLGPGYQHLKAYISEMELWRYFNDTSMLMNFDITANIRLLSPSSVNLLRQLEEEHIDITATGSEVLKSDTRSTPTV